MKVNRQQTMPKTSPEVAMRCIRFGDDELIAMKMIKLFKDSKEELIAMTN